MTQWIFNTPDKSPAFMLAKAGYDVWMGNSRGTRFSEGHMVYDHLVDMQYWNHTWEEMGTYDSPAVIDFILNTTGYDNLSYIGHSQGVTQILAGASLKPDYFKEKLNLAIFLAPPGTLYY